MTQIVNGRIKLPSKLGGNKYEEARLRRMVSDFKPGKSILDKYKVPTKYTHGFIKDPI